METAEFVFRQVTSKEEVKDFMIDYCEREHWMSCKLGEEVAWAAGPDGKGLYVGELNGEKITGVSMIQHNDSYAFGGMFYCVERQRGKGFGYKTGRASLSSLGPSVNVGIDAVPSTTTLYEKKFGFKKHWLYNNFYLSVSSILDVYGKMETPSNIRIKPATEVDFAALKLYVEDVIGFQFARTALLEKWITLSSHKAIAAVDDSGAVFGFATLRESVSLSCDGYLLAPLIADSVEIARRLLLSCAKSVEPTQRFFAGLLCDGNPEAAVIKNELDSEYLFDFVRMYTHSEVPMKKEKYFAIFSNMWVG